MELLLKIKNAEGLHARPAGILAKKAAEFQSNIQISAGGQIKSAKSIMALMSLGLKKTRNSNSSSMVLMRTPLRALSRTS